MGAMPLTKGLAGAHSLNSLETLIQGINSRNLLLSNNLGVLGGQVGSKIVTPVQVK